MGITILFIVIFFIIILAIFAILGIMAFKWDQKTHKSRKIE
jgi:hypothetical protein